jgi:FixJ family two-component response regulator
MWPSALQRCDKHQTDPPISEPTIIETSGCSGWKCREPFQIERRLFGAALRHALNVPACLISSRVIEMQPISGTTPTSTHSQTSIVYIVDDDKSMRLSLSNLLHSVGLRVETFASSHEFLAYPKSKAPSCLILDIRLPGENGLTVQQDIAKSGLRIPVLFMTGYGDIEMSVRAMKAGAVDFFPKPFRDQDMLDAIAQALARDGERLAAEQSIATLRNAYNSLTPRERQIMSFVVAGLMNKQIASEMNLSEITVKVHRGQAMRKMSARSVAELVRKADALGMAPKST